MKNIYALIAVILLLSMLLMPVITLSVGANSPSNSLPAASSVVISAEKTSAFKVLMNDGNIKEIPKKDYIFGVVASEIPAEYESETIKAQAVAAYTFALYKKGLNAGEKYDITANPEIDQCYTEKSEIIKNWGEKSAEYEKKITDAINSVENIYISFEKKPIFAAYHAISSGKTESCENIWGTPLPYLVSKDSIGDLLSQNYISTVSFSTEEFKNLLTDKCKFESGSIINNIKRSEIGTVINITVGDTEISGNDLRQALNLRSANFDVTVGETVDFTVRGYGHGVGMSQNGANYMAQQGMHYDEILLWYYSECELLKNE